MSFSIEDEKLLNAYNKVWDKVSNIMQKEFDSESMYNKKYLKTQIKSYGDKINIIFHDNIRSEERSRFACLLVIDSVFKMGKNYYPNVDECKYIVKSKRMNRFINDELEFFF